MVPRSRSTSGRYQQYQNTFPPWPPNLFPPYRFMSLRRLFAGQNLPYSGDSSGCDRSAGRRSFHISVAILIMKAEPQGTVACSGLECGKTQEFHRGALEGKHTPRSSWSFQSKPHTAVTMAPRVTIIDICPISVLSHCSSFEILRGWAREASYQVHVPSLCCLVQATISVRLTCVQLSPSDTAAAPAIKSWAVASSPNS